MAGTDDRPATQRQLLEAVRDSNLELANAVGALQQEFHEGLSTLTANVDNHENRIADLEGAPPNPGFIQAISLLKLVCFLNFCMGVAALWLAATK